MYKRQIGNQLTILQFDLNNAYERNHADLYKVDCPDLLNFLLDIDSVPCQGQNGMISLILEDGHLPISFELTLENGQVIKDSIFDKGEDLSIVIPGGRHQLIGIDYSNDTITKSLDLLDPPPLTIDVVRKERITCNDTDGAEVDLWVEGGWHPNQYRLTWSNGSVGAYVKGLAAGDHMVTLTDHNGCSIPKNIEIEADPEIKIDSLDLFLPSCFGYKDGIIELTEVINGNPPYQYSINDQDFQTQNYFDNLKAGIHTLSVKDEKGCVTSKWVQLELSLIHI